MATTEIIRDYLLESLVSPKEGQMENAEQPELCRLHTLKVSHIDKIGIWLEAGTRLAHVRWADATRTVW